MFAMKPPDDFDCAARCRRLRHDSSRGQHASAGLGRQGGKALHLPLRRESCYWMTII
jgi:hypothetical protein